MNTITRFLSEKYAQIVPTSNRRYYLHGKISEADGEVIALETTVDHYPTDEEITKINTEAAAEATRMNKESIARRITELKQQLADTDYKVIKNSEWSATQTLLTGVAPTLNDEGWPYDPLTLHNERQAIRDEINQYEND